MPDALHAATFPIYPGLEQAPNVLACIPSGLVTELLQGNTEDRPMATESKHCYYTPACNCM